MSILFPVIFPLRVSVWNLIKKSFILQAGSRLLPLQPATVVVCWFWIVQHLRPEKNFFLSFLLCCVNDRCGGGRIGVVTVQGTGKLSTLIDSIRLSLTIFQKHGKRLVASCWWVPPAEVSGYPDRGRRFYGSWINWKHTGEKTKGRNLKVELISVLRFWQVFQ